MNSILENTLFHLTGIRELSKVNEDTLAKLAQSYPYFAPVQLFLTAKLKESNPLEFSRHAQKTTLYFTNPYWLHFLLQEKYHPKPQIEELPASIDFKWENSLPIDHEAHEENLKQIAAYPIQEQLPGEHNFSNHLDIPTVESVKELMRGIDKNNSYGIDFRDDEPNMMPQKTGAEFSIDEEQDHLLANMEPYNEEMATDLSNTKISNLLSSQLADFQKPVKEDEVLEIVKEPMHTIDYFASQGIKIDLSKIPQDKLTTHLRRFTDWLKYMKKENPNPIDLGTHQDLEEAVEIIAKTSNEEREIVTETMADVLQKQGQLDKAIQLYIKLSFLNPEKSAYFASKIQHLKGIQ